MLHRRVVLLDPAGGLAQEMAVTMTSRDVLVAIAFRHYAKEVVAISDVAVANAAPIVAITDSQLSPLAKDAKVLFTVPEDEYTFSRSLAAPMCLVQCIAVATAAVLQPSRKEGPRIPTVTEIARERTVAETRRSRATKERTV
jgi:DNA-binding MurR/RpiR family transcriptional regulator